MFASRCKHGAQWVAASARQRLAGEEPGEGAEVSVVLLPREFPFLRVESCDFTSEHIDSFRLSRFLMMSLRVSRAWGSWRRTRISPCLEHLGYFLFPLLFSYRGCRGDFLFSFRFSLKPKRGLLITFPLLITLPRCSFRTSLSGVVSEGVAEVETADGSDENAKCGDQQNLHDVFSFLVFCERFP